MRTLRWKWIAPLAFAAAALVYGLNGVANVKRRRCELEVQPRSGDLLTVSFAVSHRGGTPHVTDVIVEGAAALVFDGEVEWP